MTVQPRPKSTDVQDLGKTLAEELREGRWPSTVAPWTHFTTKAQRQEEKNGNLKVERTEVNSALFWSTG